MLSQEQVKKFEQDGFLVLENFLTDDQCDEMRKECDRLIESNKFLEELEKISVFRADETETKTSDMYFLSSTDKIRPFLEHRAKEVLKEKNANEKPKAIFNKIGHALHALNPVFKNITFDDKVKQIFHSLSFNKPIVCQSMYIFKQPFIGGEVKPHQDGSYLYTDPLKVAGVWIALEDSNLQNGCLQFVPGSQKSPLLTRMIRNPNKEEFEKGKYLIYTNGVGDFKYEDSDYVAAEVKRGDAIVIDGLVVHRSSANLSAKSRHIYAFHVYESDRTVFSPENWMEPSSISFLPLY